VVFYVSHTVAVGVIVRDLAGNGGLFRSKYLAQILVFERRCADERKVLRRGVVILVV
jgi:hypothetical protein